MSQELDKLKSFVIETVGRRKVTVVVGATGTGKSTYVPLWLSKSNETMKKIVCVQPRRVAVVSLARRVASLYDNKDVGVAVGYRMRGEVCESSETRMLYVTSGYFRSMISRDPSCLESMSHVVLDEVHERSMDSDFVSLLVKLLLQTPSKYPSLKLVVMSATINTNLFVEYFSSVCRPPDSVALIEIPSRSPYRIEALYLDDLACRSDTEGERARNVIAEISQVPEVNETLIDLIAAICVDRSEDGFTTLVFLPGESAIESVEKRLLAEIPSGFFRSSEEDPDPNEAYFQVHVLHSLVPIEDQRRALKAPHNRGKHIVLATNIAESSLTVEGVNLVIDTGLKRESVYDSVRKMHSLRTNWSSRASGIQRQGRTGRVCDGTVLKLFTREMESLSMPEFEEPEAALADPALLFLSAKYICERWNKHTPSELISQLISYDPSWGEGQAPVVSDLFRQGILKENFETSKLTIFGSLATWLQLDICASKLVFLSLVFGVPVEGIVLAAAASMDREIFRFSPKFKPWKESKFFDRIAQSMKHRILYDMGFCSDLIMLRNLLVSWISLRAKPDDRFRDKERICSAPFYTGGVFVSEFQTFRNACSQIAKSFSDWLSSHTLIPKHLHSNYKESSLIVSRERVFAILESLERDKEDESNFFFSENLCEKIIFFSNILNHRKRNLQFSQSQLTDLFLPLWHYAEADLLKLIITLSYSSDRLLVANGSFSRSDGEVFSLKLLPPGSADVAQITRKITGLDPLEVKLHPDKGVCLVLADYSPEEKSDLLLMHDKIPSGMSLPQSSEFASVTACVAIRSLLCVFEKSWKTEIGIDNHKDDSCIFKVQKPYVYNVLRFSLAEHPELRVYLSPRNPSGWLETASACSIQDNNDSKKNSRNSDGRRRTLASHFFAVPVRLSAGGTVSSDISVVRADSVTILPVRCGGRVALTMLLCAAPLLVDDTTESTRSVGKLFSLDEFGQETVCLIPGTGTSFPINPAFPFWEYMISLIDHIRSELSSVIQMDLNEMFSIFHPRSISLTQNIHTLLDLANSDELAISHDHRDSITLTQSPDSLVPGKYKMELDFLRMRALQAEVDAFFQAKTSPTPLLSLLWNLVNTVWDIYESAVIS